MPHEYDDAPFEIEHIIARKHGGRTALPNLALACFYDNSYKGPNIAGLDPVTAALVGLFHPRRHKWSRHFRWDGPFLRGRTAIGRATVAVLEMNHPKRVALRAALMDAVEAATKRSAPIFCGSARQQSHRHSRANGGEFWVVRTSRT